MMHSIDGLYDALRSQLLEVDNQIEAMKKEFNNSYPIHEEPPVDRMYRMQDRQGQFILAPLIAAKANLLSNMAALKVTADANKRATRRG